MKVNSILSGAALVSAFCCSCQEVEQKMVFKGSEVVFIASTEETKVTLSGDYRTLYWSGGDAISVLDGTSNVRYETSDEGPEVQFTSTEGISDETEDVYAVYPYSENALRTDDGIQVLMPALQSVSAPGFDPQSSLAVAYTSTISRQTGLYFKNLCSYFKFTVPAEDEVVEVVLRGGEKEYLAGKVNVTFNKDIPSFTVVEGLEGITFRSDSPMNGTYIVPLLPCVLQEGLSVTLKSRDGRSAVHKVVAKDETGEESAVTFVRGKINKVTLGFDNPKWRNAPKAEIVDVCATTATLKWSENDFASAESDFAGRYHIALYADENCSTPVRSLDYEISDWTNEGYPTFCFTSLLPGSDYWFVVTDKDTEASSAPVRVTTTAVIPPEIEVEKVFWSDAFVRWTCAGDARGFKVYVNGEKVADLGPDVSGYHIQNLRSGTKYDVAVSALYNDSDEGKSRAANFVTGKISQLSRNVGPTSVSVSVENRASDIQSNNSPLLYVELYDTDDLSSSPSPLYSTYVLDAQLQSPGSPIVASKVLANNSTQNTAPFNLAFGGLRPQTNYWFRVKSVSTYTYKSYVATAVDATTSSPKGDSDFSELVLLNTTASHSLTDKEVLFQGFDGITLLSDMVNSAAGTVPGLKRDGQSLSALTGSLAESWSGTWSFACLRTGLAGTQLAQLGSKTQQNSSNHTGPFVLNNTNSNATVTAPAFCKGAKMYMFGDDWDGLSGWMFSNGTWPAQGYIQLGSYYSASDNKDQRFGFIATPALSSDKLDSEAKDCVLSFKALAIQGRGITLYVGHYDGSVWTEPVPVRIHNSAGLTTDAETWSSSDDAHRWYEYKVEMKLKNGDIVVIANDVANKNGTALLDDISIKIK